MSIKIFIFVTIFFIEIFIICILINNFFTLTSGIEKAISSVVSDTITDIKDTITVIPEQVIDVLTDISEDIKDTGDKIVGEIIDTIGTSKDFIKDEFTGIYKGIYYNFEEIYNNITSEILNAINIGPAMITKLVGNVEEDVTNEFNNVKYTLQNGVNNIKTEILSNINKVGTGITDTINTVDSGIKNTIKTVDTSIMSVVNPIKDGIVNTIDNVDSGIKNTIKTVDTSIMSVVNPVKDGIVGSFKTVETGINDSIKTVDTTIMSVVNPVKDGIVNTFKTVDNTITGTFNDAKTEISNVVDTVTDGILDVFSVIIPSIRTTYANTLALSIKLEDDKNKLANPYLLLPQPIPVDAVISVPTTKYTYYEVVNKTSIYSSPKNNPNIVGIKYPLIVKISSSNGGKTVMQLLTQMFPIQSSKFDILSCPGYILNLYNTYPSILFATTMFQSLANSLKFKYQVGDKPLSASEQIALNMTKIATSLT